MGPSDQIISGPLLKDPGPGQKTQVKPLTKITQLHSMESGSEPSLTIKVCLWPLLGQRGGSGSPALWGAGAGASPRSWSPSHTARDLPGCFSPDCGGQEGGSGLSWAALMEFRGARGPTLTYPGTLGNTLPMILPHLTGGRRHSGSLTGSWNRAG